MSKEYFVSNAISKFGPFTKAQVLEMIYESKISLTDFIVEPGTNNLLPILQHEEFNGAAFSSPTPSSKSEATAFLNPIGSSTSPKLDFSDLRQQKGTALKKQQGLGTQTIQTHKPSAPKITLTPLTAVTGNNPETKDLKLNTSANFYLKIKEKEFGPLKFLILLSLLNQKKIDLKSQVRIEDQSEWKALAHFLPIEFEKTVNVTPVFSSNILPKNLWKRKNIRIDYEEMVILNNSKCSLVAKSIDVSPEGIALVWVYNVPVNEEFELSFFDAETNLFKVLGRLTRVEKVMNENNLPLFKAVFIFNSKVSIKKFIPN